MTENKNYAGIDYFRIIAALLIVAIHTSPLSIVGGNSDFILTRIIARVGVPFFFMTSGFFLISRYSYNSQKLWSFIKRTLLIYGISILIYIPINIYNGYFKMDNLMANIIKDIFFDGTLYHLWYLPASIMGAVIAWYLVKKLDYAKGMTVATLLYVIGLFGDSYFGIAQKIPVADKFYGLLFQISDYTRNGIFFAPVFFVMGGFIANRGKKVLLKKSLIGFLIAFILMLGEGLSLHYNKVQLHDSMYIFLLPCMYYLFNAILHFQGKRKAGLRTLSLIVYIIHPMMIVVIRLAGKILHLENILIENSLIHYIMVCLTSIVFGLVFSFLWNKIKPKKYKADIKDNRAYIELDLNNLEHNVNVLKNAMPSKSSLMAVVKAKAYGHGAYETTTYLERMGVNAFAVATIDEGIDLRKYGIKGEILILGYTSINRAGELKKYDLIQTLISYDYARDLNNLGIKVKAHIKIDTGMHRLGILYNDFEHIENVFKMKNINVCGIFTHLCCADSKLPEDIAFTNKQVKDFYILLDDLKREGIKIPKIHIQSSYGLLNYPELECDYVRAGVALYGVKSLPDDDTKLKLDLRPVLSLKSKLVLIRKVNEGESIGYGRAFKAKRQSTIGILSIGYGDGFPRSLSNEVGKVIIGKNIVPVIGRICMDQLVIDLTDAKDVIVGDFATLIGNVEDMDMTAPLVAKNAGTISNELLCQMGPRLPVIVKK